MNDQERKESTQTRPSDQPPWRKKLVKILTIAVPIAWLVVVPDWKGVFSKLTTDNGPVEYGNDGIVSIENIDGVPVFEAEDGLTHFENAQVSGDKVGIKEVLAQEPWFSIKKGTSIKVIGLGDGLLNGRREVRILDGIHKDEKGWVDSEWTHKGQ
jgi:hypothetical protein